MTFDRANFGFFMAFVIIGAVLGSAFGTLIVNLIPDFHILTKNLTGPLGVNLDVLTLHVRLNLSSIVGIIAGILIFRKV